jgi:hypothetical protein
MGGVVGLVEFSARTGRPLRIVIPPPAAVSEFCGILWSDPSGQHLIADCPWAALTGTIDNGRFTPGRNLPPGSPGRSATAAAETSSPGSSPQTTLTGLPTSCRTRRPEDPLCLDAPRGSLLSSTGMASC